MILWDVRAADGIALSFHILPCAATDCCTELVCAFTNHKGPVHTSCQDLGMQGFQDKGIVWSHTQVTWMRTAYCTSSILHKHYQCTALARGSVRFIEGSLWLPINCDALNLFYLSIYIYIILYPIPISFCLNAFLSLTISSATRTTFTRVKQWTWWRLWRLPSN